VVAPAHVAGLCLVEKAREQAERERMAAEIVCRRFQLSVGAPYAVVAQQRRAGFVGESFDIDDGRRARSYCGGSNLRCCSPLVPA
jgi:hypothetical protein